MNKINNLESPPFEIDIQDDSNNKVNNNKTKENNINHEKVLCNHCGRTSSNGIRCLGICVADNDY